MLLSLFVKTFSTKQNNKQSRLFFCINLQDVSAVWVITDFGYKEMTWNEGSINEGSILLGQLKIKPEVITSGFGFDF